MILILQLLHLWNDDPFNPQLYPASRFIYDLATKQNATWPVVGGIWPKLGAALRSDKQSSLAAAMMIQKLCTLDPTCKEQSLQMIPALVAMLDGKVETQVGCANKNQKGRRKKEERRRRRKEIKIEKKKGRNDKRSLTFCLFPICFNL